MTRLTLDPVGLESGVYTVCIDGNAVCQLDLEGYPPEIPADLRAEYDALCDAVDPVLTGVQP